MHKYLCIYILNVYDFPNQSPDLLGEYVMFAGAFELCAEAPLGTGASSASGARVHAEDAPAKGLERGRGVMSR